LSAREQRRLAAIVAADVGGGSRLMGRDGSRTVPPLRRARRERIEPILARRAEAAGCVIGVQTDCDGMNVRAVET
jgi:class 3 adenylate cyclase